MGGRQENCQRCLGGGWEGESGAGGGEGPTSVGGGTARGAGLGNLMVGGRNEASVFEAPQRGNAEARLVVVCSWFMVGPITINQPDPPQEGPEPPMGAPFTVWAGNRWDRCTSRRAPGPS